MDKKLESVENFQATYRQGIGSGKVAVVVKESRWWEWQSFQAFRLPSIHPNYDELEIAVTAARGFNNPR